jgi:hypothetical protein
MSDIKLFKVSNGSVQELQGASIAVEKTLQTLIENHLEAFLGIRFLKTEHPTGKTHGGRIDTLGIDENGSPVIIEYKRALNENVINQGLFYLDWLMDHKAEFELLVMKKLGDKAADAIEWSAPRLLCIASDFTRYDEHAVQQINRNIELIRYGAERVATTPESLAPKISPLLREGQFIDMTEEQFVLICRCQVPLSSPMSLYIHN